MWERKSEKARWNGLELNILSTGIDGGKRLHISEIPYADLPVIKVMGSAASNLSIEVVLVGDNSLVDANALLANLDKTPKGELEHPWLGELPLVFQTYSLKIDTKLGLVTLSLEFVRGGALPVLSPVVSSSGVFNAEVQAEEVITVSSSAFADDVNKANISDLSALRANFTNLVTKLQGVTGKLSVPSQILSQLNRELNSALASISTMANAPTQFAEQFSKTTSSVAKAVRSEPMAANEAVDNARQAQASMLDLIDPLATSPHFNIQLVVAAVLMSKDITELALLDTFDVVQSSTQPVFVLNDLQRITAEIDARILEATSVSTLESLVLFNALVVLKNGIEGQIGKVKKGSVPTQHQTLPRPIPSLTLAHDNNLDPLLVMALNSGQHPLFLIGPVALAVSS